MITLKDLKIKGLTLTKIEAQELHGPISEIAQRGADTNIVFEGKEEKPVSKVIDMTSQKHFTEMAQKLIDAEKRITELEKENAELSCKLETPATKKPGRPAKESTQN